MPAGDNPASLLDEARGYVRRPGGTCSVEILYAKRPDLAAELREALASEVTSDAISRALGNRGVDIPTHTLQRHRKGGCRCRS